MLLNSETWNGGWTYGDYTQISPNFVPHKYIFLGIHITVSHDSWDNMIYHKSGLSLTTNWGINYHWLLQHLNQPSSHHFPVVLHSIVAFKWSLFQLFSSLESSTVMLHTDSDPSISTLWHICQHSSSPVSPRSVSKSVTLPPLKISEIFWMPGCMPNG